MYYKGMHVEQP